MDTSRQKTPAEEKYADIINRPHHSSPTRPHMSNYDRAAQFSPFAALTGYDAAVEETARLTAPRAVLSDDKKQMLDEKLRLLVDMADSPPTVRITRFLPDERKAGGSYETAEAKIKAVDTYAGCVVLADKRRIPIEDIWEIEF